MMGVFSFVMIPVMQLFSNAIIGLFVNEPEVIAYGATGMKITSWFYLALGTIYVIRGTLNGVGDALFAFINGIVEVIGRIAVPLIIDIIGFLLMAIPYLFWDYDNEKQTKVIQVLQRRAEVTQKKAEEEGETVSGGYIG